MSNPARDLLEIYTEWRTRVQEKAQKGVQVSMDVVVDPASSAGRFEIINLARSLAQLEGLLAQLERAGVKVGGFRRQSPDWWSGLVTPGFAWSSAINADMIMDEQHMTEIEVCADFLDGHVMSLELTEPVASGLRDWIGRAWEILNEDNDLTDELQVYIRRLLSEIQTALDDERFGAGFDYADAFMRLKVAFKAAASEDTAKSGAWQALWTGFASSLTASVAFQGGTIVLAAITQ